MAALSISPGDVQWVRGPTKVIVSGAAFNAGDVIFDARTSGVSIWLKAQCDGTENEAGRNDLGMALGTAAGAGQVVSVALAGAVVFVDAGSTAETYFVGPTAGDLVPRADLSSGHRVTIAAIGKGDGELELKRIYTGRQLG